MYTALYINVSSPSPWTFILKSSQTLFLQISGFLPQEISDFPTKQTSDIILLPSNKPNMSGNSSTTTLFGSGSIDAAPCWPKKVDDTQKADVAEPGKSASAKPATAKPAKAISTETAPAKFSPEKPATGEHSRLSEAITDGFQFANWGWTSPPPMNQATAEAAQDFQRKCSEKKPT